MHRALRLTNTYLGSLAGGLGGELFAGSFTSGGLPSGLLIKWMKGMISIIILLVCDDEEI
jgi:hypothetical protein